MGATAEENRAAAMVRRVIQRVRVATPETLETLQAEVQEEIDKQQDALGSLLPKVQEEAEKGIAIGDKHVQQILARREKEQAVTERPRELIQEFTRLVDAWEEKIQQLKVAAALDGQSALTLDECPAVREHINEFSKELPDHNKEIKAWMLKNQAELSKPTLPVEVRKQWQDITRKSAGLVQDGNVSVAKAKACVDKLEKEAKSKMLEQIKGRLSAKLKEAFLPVGVAEEAIKECEKKVEPFAKVKNGVDLEELAGDALSSIELAKAMVAEAKSSLCPPVDLQVDELVKKDVEEFCAKESKRHELRLGQFERRICRATNLVAFFQNEKKKKHNREIFSDLKADVLMKVRALCEAEVVKPVEVAIKEAESSVIPLAQHAKLEIEEMEALATAATEAVAAAKAAMEEAKSQMLPWDNNLDMEVKTALRKAAAADIRPMEIKLGQLDRRIARTAKLLETFEGHVRKKKEATLKDVKASVVRVVRIFQKGTGNGSQLNAEELFDLFDIDRDGVVNEGEFLAFFDSAEANLQHKGVIVEGGFPALPFVELQALFATLCEGSGQGLTKKALRQLGAPQMQVVKATTLTAGLSIANSKALRQLRPGEIVEVTDGPENEKTAGVMRVKVVAEKDGAAGWATVAGNAGTIFLKELTKGADA